MTTSTLVSLPGAVPSAGSPTLFYTSPALTVTTLFQFLVLNTSPSVGTTYSIWIIPSGGTAPVSGTDQPANLTSVLQPIAGYERQTIPDKFVLEAGDMIYVFATLATLTFRGSCVQQA